MPLPATPVSIENGVQEWKLDSWKDFFELVSTQFHDSPAFIFRGQSDATWKIESALDRLEKRFPNHKVMIAGKQHNFNCPPAPRDVHLLAFRQALRGRPGVALPNTDDECWALAQHHGLATPMLDWSMSPFVALFFAFEDASEAQERLVAAVSSSVIDEKGTPDDPAPMPFLPRSEASHRLLAQSGLFVRMPPGSDLEGYIRSHFSGESTHCNAHARTVLAKVRIQNTARDECLKMLNKMNINRMTLFPDLEGATRFINSLWELDFDTSFGYISRSPCA